MKSWATTQTVTALSRMLRVSWSHPKACVSPCTSRASQLTGVSIYTFAVILTLPQAKGIATRRRLGKVKHLETRTLSVQDKVGEGVVLIRNERQQQRQYGGSWYEDFEWE